MPLLIRVEDFQGEVLAERNDQQALLNPLLDYCHQYPTATHVFKYLDLYDDTVLNSLQVKDLMADIDFLQRESELMNEPRKAFLSVLLELCQEALQEPHRYLKFYGD